MIHPGLARARQSLYGAARIGDFVVNRNLSLMGWAVVLLSVAALAGCGRKGGLDLPPNASAPSAANANANLAAPVDSETEAASKPSVFNPTYGADAAPAAPKGNKRSFILDPLLGN